MVGLMLSSGIIAGSGSAPPPPPPALTLEGWSTPVTANGTTTLTPTLPSGWQEGELFLVPLAWSDKRTITPPAGWTTSVFTHVHSGSGGGVMHCYSRITSSSESNPTFSFSNNCSSIGSIIRVSGFDATTPMDATATTGQGTSTNGSSPTITTVTDGALVLRFLNVNWGSWASGGQDTGYPTSPSQTGMFVRRTGAGAGNHQVLGAAYAFQASNGASGAAAWSMPTSTFHWIGATVAIRPAS